jgi:hypothetical protein
MTALGVRYAEPEWLLWEEMSLDGVGRADAIAINAYPSSGHVVHGFEVKASRADWRRELKTMRKSNGAFVYCHRWYLVTLPGIVDRPELPQGWGLLEMREKDGIDTLFQTVKPAVLTPLKHFSTSHYLAMARRTRRKEVEDVHRAVEMAAEYRRGFAAGQGDAKLVARHDADRDRDKLDALRAFEDAVGQPLYRFNVGRIATAVRWALQHEGQLERHVGYARQQAQRFLVETAWAERGEEPADTF